VSDIAPSVQNRSGHPDFHRGPRRVRRDPDDSYRQLAQDYAATEDLIAELKMSEQEAWALANAARSSARELITLLSHELRNPLQAIFGYAELLQEGIHGDLNADQLCDVSRIQQSQHQLLDLLNAVLMRVRTERLAAPTRANT
jgi:signal transduction histidine kinase